MTNTVPISPGSKLLSTLLVRRSISENPSKSSFTSKNELMTDPGTTSTKSHGSNTPVKLSLKIIESKTRFPKFSMVKRY